MLMFRGCPRCRGDLIAEVTNGLTTFHCLQCSREWTPAGQSPRRDRIEVQPVPERARPGRPRKQMTA